MKFIHILKLSHIRRIGEAVAAKERQEGPFIANGLKERLGMRMERRRENGVREGTTDKLSRLRAFP